MGNAPWAPTQGSPAPSSEPDKPNGVAGQPTPSGEVQEVIDENDPRLVSETLDANLEADAYAQPAPPPDGKYRFKLKLEGVKVEGSTDKKDYIAATGGKEKLPYYKTSISCSVIDPSGKYDGIICYPAFGGGASTQRRRDGSTQVSTILHRIKKADGTTWAQGFKGSQLEWMQLFVKAMATEPEIGGETAWEASCMACAEELKKVGKYAARTTGMHHFPQERDGAKIKAGLLFQPEIKCSVNAQHGYAKARAIVVRFLHLHELK